MEYHKKYIQLYRMNHIHKNWLLFWSHVQRFQFKSERLASTRQLEWDNSQC